MSLVRHVVHCTRPGSNSVWRIRIHLQFERWYAPEMARKGFERPSPLGWRPQPAPSGSDSGSGALFPAPLSVSANVVYVLSVLLILLAKPGTHDQPVQGPGLLGVPEMGGQSAWGLWRSEKDEGPALRGVEDQKVTSRLGTGLASGHTHPRTTAVITTTTADRCALHWTTRGRPPASRGGGGTQLPNGLPHSLAAVEISGWADVASMQEHVAHLPDAARRDRWSREFWTAAPSYLSTF